MPTLEQAVYDRIAERGEATVADLCHALPFEPESIRKAIARLRLGQCVTLLRPVRHNGRWICAYSVCGERPRDKRGRGGR